MKIVGIIFLLVVAIAISCFLFLGNNDFKNFRELRKNLVETGQIITGGREISFIWNKVESRLEEKGSESTESVDVEIFPKTEADDLDGDGKNEEFVLSQGLLTFYRGKRLFWRSPSEWWVDDFFLADANGDGKKEINLSVWKAGDFGRSKPFWVKKNDQSIKNHFFVMSLAGDEIRPLWQSSNLEAPNCEFLFSDIDADGKQELIVIEGEYNNKYICQGKYLALWRWNGWGFTNDWRSQPGEYRDLRINQVGQNLIIKVNKHN